MTNGRQAGGLFAYKALLALFLWSLPLSSVWRFWPEWSLLRGQRIDYFSPAIYVSDLILIVSLIFLILKRPGTIREFFGRQQLIIGLGLVLAIINTYWSVRPVLTAYFWIQILISVLVFFLIFESRRLISQEFMILSFASGLILQVLIGIGQFYLNSSLGLWLDRTGAPPQLSQLLWAAGEVRFSSVTPGIALAAVQGQLRLRAYGTLPHPNVLAGFFLIAIGLLVASYMSFSSFRQNLAKFLVFFLSLGLLFTFSRTAWLTAGILGLILIFKKVSQGPLPLFLLGVFLVSLLAFTDRWQSLWGSDFLAWEERVVLLRAGSVMIKARPFFGLGLGAFVAALPQTVIDVRQAHLLQPVHNLFWLWLAETGFLGLILAARIGQKLFNNLPALYWPIVLLIGLLSLTDHYFLTLHQGRFLLATSFALMVNLPEQKKNLFTK